jgi:trimeric autotransporter adhesin
LDSRLSQLRICRKEHKTKTYTSMKKFLISSVIFAIFLPAIILSQTPQAFKYQCVVRTANGAIKANQPVGFRISLLQGSATGTSVYQETQSATTNQSGLASLNIGMGTVVSGNMSTIDWSKSPYYVKIEADVTGGTAYQVMGTAQLLSVPYALYSNKVSGKGKFVVNGTTDIPTDTALFEVKDKNGLTVFAVYQDGAVLYVNEGAKGAKSGFSVGGRKPGKGYVTKDIMRITPDSVRFYINNGGKGSKGGFAVGGRDAVKSVNPKYLYITQDSSRIYTTDTVKGFGVGSLQGTSVTSYLRLNPLNYFIGHQSGDKITLGTPYWYSGKYNSVMGYQSAMNMTSGAWNSFLGYEAGASTTTGIENNGIGAFALYSNTKGKFNTANGVMALYSNDTGSYNTASGAWSMAYNTTGNYNTAYGQNSLKNNISGSYNTATGNNSLMVNDSGSFNTANGAWALRHNTTGGNNTAVGTDAINFNTIGNYNTGIGSEALVDNTIGEHNTGVGSYSLYYNTTGLRNTAVGSKVLEYNTIGSWNSALGMDALYNNTEGNYNSASGYQALFSNTTGIDNAAFGAFALGSNTTASFNTAISYKALYENITGEDNTSIGWGSMMNNTSGYSNSASGEFALCYNTTGYYNTALGLSSLFTNTTGYYNTAIGAYADVGYDTLVNATAIGYNATVNASNSLVLGNGANVGIGNSAPLSTLTVNGSVSGKYRAGSAVSMDATDFFVNLTGAGTATLPWAMSVAAGSIIIVRNSTSSTITVTTRHNILEDNHISSGASPSYTLSISAYGVVRFISDGSNLWVAW